jgi:hypothetical protein
MMLLAIFALMFSRTFEATNIPIKQTWSNRLGTTLTPIATGIWAAERPFYWNSIDVGGKIKI